MPGSNRADLVKEIRDVPSLRPPVDAQNQKQQPCTELLKPAPNTTQQRNTAAKLADQLGVDAGSKDADGYVQQQASITAPASKHSSNVGRAWVADAAGDDTSGRTRLSKAKSAIKSFCQVIRAHPYILIVSLLTTAVLCTAGVMGVLAAAETETRHRKDSAADMADNAAVAFQVQLQQVFSPLAALAAVIHVQPNYAILAPKYNGLAADLLSQLPVPGSIASLQMSPQGVVRSFYPLEGNEAALNHDLFRDPQRRGAALETIRNGELTMQGPVTLLQGFRGAVGRLPVFVKNVTEDEWFGALDRPYNCDICYNKTTRTKFWGFVSCIVKLQDLATGKDTRLAKLVEMGYDYEFFAPQPGSEAIMIAASGTTPVQPVVAVVEVPNNQWRLLVAPSQGWIPTWRDPMLAAAVIVSSLIGLLVMATLVSRQLQRWLLKEMKVSNRALAAEKQRMDVLLARQYNLISLMAQHGSLGSSSKLTSSLEEKTLDQIDSMRRQIGAASFNAGGDQLQLLELLGEGTFGKVYKGIWRGSTVAIKTMILPARMSGAEKRERMAIMEAAISSIMNHPNIVQTYTYTIQPATATNAAAVRSLPSDQTYSASGGGGNQSTKAEDGSYTSTESQGFEADGHVHSFEVNLVLEYCDWGCLRDALNAGAFYTNNSLNYSAILDTAADVAKAMLHLHCNQVLHSDLKVRNILLKSDGSSERGCIAKVADFGLAVKMENQDTHVSVFQGTMSHMAPEAMLRGHISKAADVYSFGITLWELFTGGHAYHGIPKALLGHQVAVGGLRPSFPAFTPAEYKALAEACWEAQPDKRPCFADILSRLQRMRSRISGATLPMSKVVPQQSMLSQREADDLQQQVALTPPDSTAMQQRVAAAEAVGALQLGSFYIDMGSSMAHGGSSSSSIVQTDCCGSSSDGSVSLIHLPQQHMAAAAVTSAASYVKPHRANRNGKLPPICDVIEECDDALATGTDEPSAAKAANDQQRNHCTALRSSDMV